MQLSREPDIYCSCSVLLCFISPGVASYKIISQAKVCFWAKLGKTVQYLILENFRLYVVIMLVALISWDYDTIIIYFLPATNKKLRQLTNIITEWFVHFW